MNNKMVYNPIAMRCSIMWWHFNIAGSVTFIVMLLNVGQFHRMAEPKS